MHPTISNYHNYVKEGLRVLNASGEASLGPNSNCTIQQNTRSTYRRITNVFRRSQRATYTYARAIGRSDASTDDRGELTKTLGKTDMLSLKVSRVELNRVSTSIG